MKTTKKTAAKIAWTALAVMLAFSLASCGSVYDDNNAVTYIGTKAPTEAKVVGDIVFTDGSATAYSADLTLTDEQQAKAEAVVFYVGSADSALGNRTLAVNVKNSGTKKYAWTTELFNFTDLQCTNTTTKPESGTYYEYTYRNKTYYVTGDLDGSDNWEKIKATDPTGTADDVVAENYPAFNYVNTELGENYYLPTLAELEELLKNLTAVNASITAAGGTGLTDSATYWSSSLDITEVKTNSFMISAWSVYLKNGQAISGSLRNSKVVCGVRAFSN